MNDRIIKRIPLSELTEVNDFYERLSGIDPSHVESKYGSAVEDARRLIAAQCQIAMVYRRVRITGRDADSVTLESGDVLTGKMPAEALAHAEELYAFVIVLEGYTSLHCDDMMVEYFADTWGSAYTECAQAKLAGDLLQELKAENMIRTHLWCPGQHTFALKNQQAIFSLLRPEDIGCTLTGRLMMLPVKACSGIMGIVPADTTDLPKPCDYCAYGSTCPASKRGCAAL